MTKSEKILNLFLILVVIYFTWQLLRAFDFTWLLFEDGSFKFSGCIPGCPCW
jgi:hypothetical protein